MKKSLSSILMGVLLIFSSCQNEDDFSNSSSLEVNQTLNTRLYGVKLPDADATRGVAIANKLWHNGTTISVRLLNDPYNMSTKVKSWAGEWEKYANIKFNFVDSGDALVRIGFDWNDSKSVTWSYTGTDCKYVTDQNEATVNFAYWDAATDIEKRGDVLRAFGQVLGLELEHRHLSFDPGWRNNISKYWEGEITDITWGELKKYVFDPLENSSNIIQTEEYDANSIMIWPFSSKYAKNTARSYNYDLSDQDIEFIKKIYPKESKPVTFYAKKGNALDFGNPLTFNLTYTGSLTIDWGDGTVEVISGNQQPKHLYTEVRSSFIITITGDTHLVTSYSSDYTIAEQAKGGYRCQIRDISGLTGLEYFTTNEDLIKWGITNSKIDLTKNTNLKKFIWASFNIPGIDLSTCSQLEEVEINVVNGSLGPDVKLPLSSNTLKKVYVYSSQYIPNIDGLAALEELTIKSQFGSSLNVAKNVKLKKLTTDACYKLTSLDLSKNVDLEYVIYGGKDGFVKTKEHAEKFANSLPSRVGKTAGTLKIGGIIDSNTPTQTWIESIAKTKNWIYK